MIAMSVLVLNLRKIQRALLRMLAYLLEILAQNKNWALVQWTLHRKNTRFSPFVKQNGSAAIGSKRSSGGVLFILIVAEYYKY